jgi:putative membrane-bound dehydrogenase-like protein
VALAGFAASIPTGAAAVASGVANRLTYLDDSDPFHVAAGFPRLTTPQWVGEPGVEAVIILAIDDMRDHQPYEAYLRPILDRLKQLTGSAPVSIMCNALNPGEPQLQTWLREGVSLEVHTLSHPCPLLAKGDFAAAAATYEGGIALLRQVPNNRPVAFRMPCCDSINSPSPRFYSEIFNRIGTEGEFLAIDSSVMNVFTPRDPVVAPLFAADTQGTDRFRRYLPFPAFVTTIENYPYPYLIDRLCWEFPCVVPSDWEAQNVQGVNQPRTIADWTFALDATVLKQGTFNLVFHPHGWIRNEQLVEWINTAVARYGPRIKFMNFRDAAERLDAFLLSGQPVRDAHGADNGVRLLDVNNDGFMDVVIGNQAVRKTRLWDPERRRWRELGFPVRLVGTDANGTVHSSGVRFGVLQTNGFASLLVRSDTAVGGWHFDGSWWIEDPWLWAGLEASGQAVSTAIQGRDRGVRLRDVDHDGTCELLVANEVQNALFRWSALERTWKPMPFALPGQARIARASGADDGLRFVDLNEDGFEDVVHSNHERFGIYLYVPAWFLGFQQGWTREVQSGARSEPWAIPAVARAEPRVNNGAWFHSKHLWVQNEDTASLPDLVDRRSFKTLLAGIQPRPLAPAEALRTFRLHAGFRIELVAHEPMVEDPIAFEWGADGALWVVEMGDYPLGADAAGRPGGRVRRLEDTDADGRYDRSTVFLDALPFPTGVTPWRKGILVSAAPHLLYAEDTNGDGTADERRVLFDGFGEGNQQHRFNGFEYGLDNWLYGANGDSGGVIRSVRSGATAALSGHDFRFHPDDGRFEVVAGQTQFGRRRDDWGNWFGNNNPAWGWHFHLPLHYTARNPHLAVTSHRQMLAGSSDGTRVFAISKPLQRFNDVGMAHHVTSGNSPTPYRDELFGPGFASSLFISEPVHNVVHREVLEPSGVSFSSHRAAEELRSEFLASSDPWFRPIMLKTGPDGALYIADMYRLVLEHPEWIPKDTQEQFDLRAGHDKGRLYRVVPDAGGLRSIPNLAAASVRQLLAHIDSPNGWQRDTAQRLLVCAQERASAPALEQLALESARPKARVQALATLEGLQALTPRVLLRAIADPHPAVREHALRLTEPWLSSTPALETAVSRLADDPELRVRFQLAFTLGASPSPSAGRTLARLAAKDAGDVSMRTAVLSSALPHLTTLIIESVRLVREHPSLVGLLEQLFSVASRSTNIAALAAGIDRIAASEVQDAPRWTLAALTGLLDAHPGGLSRALPAALHPRIKDLERVFGHARAIALDPARPVPERTVAVRLLGQDVRQRAADVERLARLLHVSSPVVIQRAAVDALARVETEESARQLLAAWTAASPPVRDLIVRALLGRSAWTTLLLSALESETLTLAAVPIADRQKLVEHSDPNIGNRARALFGRSERDRQAVLGRFADSLGSRGDAARGRQRYLEACAACHRFHDQGQAVGPDLGALSSKSPLALLAAILDPNQAVESRYFSYTAELTDEREVTGLLSAETPTHVTLRGPGAVEHTITRREIIRLVGTGRSLMPEGFETALDGQALADLITYLTSAPTSD